jgi:hypothetical protein
MSHQVLSILHGIACFLATMGIMATTISMVTGPKMQRGYVLLWIALHLLLLIVFIYIVAFAGTMPHNPYSL